MPAVPGVRGAVFRQSAVGRLGNSHGRGSRWISTFPPSEISAWRFVPLQQGHSDQRFSVYVFDQKTPHTTVPNHRGIVNIEGAFAAIRQYAATVAVPWEPERGDYHGRQGKPTGKTRVDDGFDLPFASPRSTNLQPDPCFEVFDCAGDHGLERISRPPKR